MNKRKSDFYPLKDLMQSFVDESNLSTGIRKIRVKEAWFEVMGRGVASYTLSVELRKTTLTIRLASSVLREELGYKREKIITMLNDAIGDRVVFELLLI